MSETKAPKPAPLAKPLWRLKVSERHRALWPFLDRRVRIDRWFGRVASMGDQQYEGVLVAIATSTTGGNADLAILRTDGGMTWAISLAQIYYLEAL